MAAPAGPAYPRLVRVCIVGAGAIGGLLATRLAVAGEEVSVFARGATLAAIRDTGLTLVEPDGSVVAAPTVDASDDLAVLGPQDVVVLSLKAHQITAIADRLEALYDEGTVVVPVQNGVPWWFFQKLPGPFEGRRLQSLDPDGTIERHVPPHRIIGCIAYPAAEREQPAVIRIVEGDRFPVGELDGSRSERVAALGADAHRRRLHVPGPHRHPGPPLGQGLGQPRLQPDQCPHRGDPRRDLPAPRHAASWRRR